MSSDPPTGDPSKRTDGITNPGLAATVRERGEPLIEALEQHLPGSRNRADAIGSWASAAAVAMGFSAADAALCQETGRLHDIGKVYLPVDLIRRDPRGMDTRETELLETHHEAGARLAAGAGVPELVAGWLRRVGERFDGSAAGGLAGYEIPVVSRVVKAAFWFELVLSAHVAAAGSGAPSSPAFAQLRGLGGTQLDPAMVEALIAVLEGDAPA